MAAAAAQAALLEQQQNAAAIRAGQTTSSSSSSSTIITDNKTQITKASDIMNSINTIINPGSKSTTVKNSLELSNDPNLFRTPLFTSGQVWNSTKAVEGGKIAENLMIKLPNYMVDPFNSPNGRNTLVVSGEYFKIPGYGRVYAAINIGDVKSSTSTTSDSTILNRDVITQVSFRIDPNKAAASTYSSTDDAISMRYRYHQSYKTAGRWDSTYAGTKNLNASNWPFTENKPFYIRIILDARGVFSYVDGKAFLYTPYPPGWKPESDHSLIVQIPIAGDSGEKATWKIHGLWWGICRVDENGENIYREYMKNHSTTSTVQTVIENEIYITGLPVGAGDAAVKTALMDAFRNYGAIDVKKETVGSAVVIVPDPSKVEEAINATDRRITILGSVVNVKKAIRSLDKSGVSNPTTTSNIGSSTLPNFPGPPMTNRSTPGYSSL